MSEAKEKAEALVEMFDKWFYEFKHGHPFLLDEEATIIVSTRLSDKSSLWMNDRQIQELVDFRIQAMYKKKFPNAKRWSLKKLFSTNRVK